MPELITYDAIRKVHRAEKNEIALQKLPDSFFLAVRGWLDHKQSAQKGTASLLEIENAKRLLEDLMSRREKKLVIGALHTTRGDLPPKNMILDEEKIFDSLVRLLKQARQDMREQMFGYDSIIEEKLESARSAMNEMKAAGEDGKISLEKTEEKNIENEIPGNKAETEVKKEASESQVQNNEKIIEAQNGKTRIRIKNDISSFVDAEMKAYGPFKSGAITELPDGMARILLARNAAEVI